MVENEYWKRHWWAGFGVGTAAAVLVVSGVLFLMATTGSGPVSGGTVTLVVGSDRRVLPTPHDGETVYLSAPPCVGRSAVAGMTAYSAPLSSSSSAELVIRRVGTTLDGRVSATTK